MKRFAIFLTAFIWFLCSQCAPENIDDRIMNVAKYIAENCRDSELYHSLPVHVTTASKIGNDSLGRLVKRLESDIKSGRCPQ